MFFDRHISRWIVSFILLLIIATFIGISVYAAPEDHNSTEQGWIELSAQVPEGFTADVIALLVNEDTFEEFDIPLLAANNYTKSLKLPYGTYIVEQGYCAKDIRYGGFSDVDTIKLDSTVKAAVPIKYTFDILDAYAPSEAPPDEPNTEPSVELIESEPEEDPSDTDTAKEDSIKEEDPGITPDPGTKEASLLRNFIVTLLGTAVFVAIVFTAVYFVRKFKEE